MLIAVAVVIFVISRNMGNETMLQMQMNDPEIQAAINERIEPFGQVVLDGEIVADEAEVAAVVDAEEAPALLTGPQVYNVACMACHGGGIAGAPKTGDAVVWAPRIAMGMDILNQNALNGLQGSAGFMPPKGGRGDLSDEEVIAAVQYLVDQAN